MKISIIASIILLLTLVFFLFGIIVEDFDLNYVLTNVTTAGEFNQSLISDFDDTAALNASIAPVQEGFEKIETSEGFFNSVLNFAVVIPKAIIAIPKTLLTIASIANERVQDVLNLLGIPQGVVVIALVALMIFVLFKLAGWWQGRDV